MDKRYGVAGVRVPVPSDSRSYLASGNRSTYGRPARDCGDNHMGPVEFEYYMSKYEITAWKDGAVFRTKFMETGWFDADTVDSNVPSETNVLYVAANDDFAQRYMTVRRKKK